MEIPLKAYKDLTQAGKLRRLHVLAQSALAQYDLDSPRLEYFAFETNILFRVRTPSGEQFMLRLASPGWRTFADLQSEALWLNALRRDTSLPVPWILPAMSGEYVLPMQSPAVPHTWNASLMTWVPGRLLGKHLTEANIEKMGALFAALHIHGKSWQPPAGFTTRRFEHWLSRGEPNLIAGGPGAQSLPPPLFDRIERTHQQVEAAYAALDRADLRVIHCDLWHDNIKLHKGVLYPLDFEDTVWGFRSHDIAMAMLDLLETVGEERYAVLLQSFRKGYTAHLAWPAGSLEVFQIGRLLWKVNWVARFQPQRLLTFAEAHAPVFEHFEQTGRVIKPPEW
jgi:Ser/Thr protein kinase RdoA (MazF antagonist)